MLPPAAVPAARVGCDVVGAGTPSTAVGVEKEEEVGLVGSRREGEEEEKEEEGATVPVAETEIAAVKSGAEELAPTGAVGGTRAGAVPRDGVG